jgi:uncharacterized protein (TIGR02996 family)
MPDEAALRAALAARPDDELPRLAYADWLNERGDPRAAWVRDPDIWRHAGPDFCDPLRGGRWPHAGRRQGPGWAGTGHPRRGGRVAGRRPG